MQSNKAPGPDGFPIARHKTFIDKLAPILKAVYQEVFTLEKIPLTMRQATISVLHKEAYNAAPVDQ